MPHPLDITTATIVVDLQSKLPFHLRIALASRMGLNQSKPSPQYVWGKKFDQLSALSLFAWVLCGVTLEYTPILATAVCAISLAWITGLQLTKWQLLHWFKCISKTGGAPELLAYARSVGISETYLAVLGQQNSNLVHCDLLICRALARKEWRALKTDAVVNNRAIGALMDVGFEQFHSYNVSGTQSNTYECLQSDKLPVLDT
jgi:hypothetical protein